MNWNDILISVCSIVITCLATWGLGLFTNWLNDKLKDKKFGKYATETLNIVVSCVKATYQTYVEAIKGTDLWTKEAQENALNQALEAAKAQINGEIKDYLEKTYGGVDIYLTNMIESVLYDLKK